MYRGQPGHNCPKCGKFHLHDQFHNGTACDVTGCIRCMSKPVIVADDLTDDRAFDKKAVEGWFQKADFGDVNKFNPPKGSIMGHAIGATIAGPLLGNETVMELAEISRAEARLRLDFGQGAVEEARRDAQTSGHTYRNALERVRIRATLESSTNERLVRDAWGLAREMATYHPEPDDRIDPCISVYDAIKKIVDKHVGQMAIPTKEQQALNKTTDHSDLKPGDYVRWENPSSGHTWIEGHLESLGGGIAQITIWSCASGWLTGKTVQVGLFYDAAIRRAARPVCESRKIIDGATYTCSHPTKHDKGHHWNGPELCWTEDKWWKSPTVPIGVKIDKLNVKAQDPDRWVFEMSGKAERKALENFARDTLGAPGVYNVTIPAHVTSTIGSSIKLTGLHWTIGPSGQVKVLTDGKDMESWKMDAVYKVKIDPLDLTYDNITLRELLQIDEAARQEKYLLDISHPSGQVHAGVLRKAFTNPQKVAVANYMRYQLQLKVKASEAERKTNEPNVIVGDDELMLANCKDVE